MIKINLYVYVIDSMSNLLQLFISTDFEPLNKNPSSASDNTYNITR